MRGMTLKFRFIAAAFALAMLILITGCSSSRSAVQPELDPELANLTKEQIFARADELYAQKKWSRSRKFYSHVYEYYPNDPLGRRGLLRVADTYFQQGDPINLIEAQYKYRDFVNRYPASENADYAMLQIAMVAFKQMEGPERDQTKTREAITKLEEMLAAYPDSPLRPEAEERMREARGRLARADHAVAEFYLKRGNPRAALGRLNYLVETYPAYEQRPKVFFDLGRALEGLGRLGEARLYYERVIAEFPDSGWAKDAKERLGSLDA